MKNINFEEISKFYPYPIYTVDVYFNNDKKNIKKYIHYKPIKIMCGDLVIVPIKNGKNKEFVVGKILNIINKFECFYPSIYKKIEVNWISYERSEEEFKKWVERIDNIHVVN